MAGKKKAAKQSRPVVLRPPGESSDPAVHQLMAERYTATQNGNKADEAATTKKLNELGYL